MNPTQPSDADPAMTADITEAKIPELQQRRSQVKAAMDQLKSALTEAGPDSAVWLARIEAELNSLRAAFESHVQVHEVDSFFSDIQRGRPHLISHVRRLERDHLNLGQALDSLQGQLADARADASSAVDEIRNNCRDVLDSFAQHRRRGADLVWEAFNHDLGGED